MSILIRNMKMPKDCPYCKMAHYNSSDEFTGCDAVPNKRYAMHNDAAYAKSTQRPDWCPLVEVPTPHGRLIDVDKLLRDAPRYVDYPPHYEPKLLSILDVENAPTVIEAEGTDEGSN